MDFKDKVVLITGAGSGIGAATAVHFSKQSAKLALVDIKEDNLKRIAIDCEKSKNIKPLTIIADITVDEDLVRIVRKIIDHFGKIDILINNAGIVLLGGIKNSNMEIFDKVRSINLRSVYHLTMMCIPHLVKTKGCIVNVSSAASTQPNTLCLAYNMSKAALDQFTKCTALELASDGVRVNAVNLGFVRSNILKNIMTEEARNELEKINLQDAPLKKFVDADDVANLIAFLSSNKAKCVTGSCYVMDCGRLLN